MKNKFIQLLFSLFIYNSVNAQTVIYSENFESAPNWTLTGNGQTIIPASTPAPGGSPNFFVINNVGQDIDGTANLHITCGGFICNLLGAPGPVYNASGAANNTNTVAFMNNDVPASAFTGPGPFTLSFQWSCDGATNPNNGSGRLIYSINNGTTWVELPFNYNGSTGLNNQSIDMSTLPGFTPGVTPFRLGFRWFNQGTSGHNDPPLIVDNIQITTPSGSNSVTVGTVAGQPLCAGASSTVSFTSTGTFNSGNVYVAQLSDANGNFIPSTNIGSLANTANSGSIPITIPAGATTSSNYLIRIVSSNPLITSVNTVPVSIVASVTPSVSIASSQTNICSGTSVTFTATPTNGGTTPTYSWTVNGTPAGTNAATFTSTTLTNGENVQVTMTSNATCASPTTANSNIISMTVNNSVTPSVSIAASQTNICSGTSVTFTATPTNGGTTPTYAWTVNGTPAGTNAATFTSTTLTNGANVQVTMTSNATCASPTTANSNIISMTVNNSVTPSVSIAASQTNICSGTSVTFTATPTNGGTTPTYAWTVNGTPAGTNAATFTSTTLTNGENVQVTMTSNATCASPTTANSNIISMTVNNSVTPSVSIAASQTNICSGTSVTFTATPTNGGTTPTYAWTVNGTPAGTNAATFTSTTLTNGANVQVTMTSNATCASPTTANSNIISMTVNNSVTPSVSIAASQTNICSGTSVTFTATPTNGGTTPTYAWTVNGTPAGTNAATFTSTTLTNGANVQVTMTSNATCASPTTANSNIISMTVNNSVTPSVSIAASQTNICSGTSVTFTATPTNGGTTPTYAWTVNGTPAGTNAETFASNTIANGDIIQVNMTSNELCATPSIVSSNSISIQVNPVLNISFTISTASTTFCLGETVVFNSTTNFPLNDASYQWFINGVNQNINNPILTTNSLQDGASISAVVTSTDACLQNNIISSNSLLMNVGNTDLTLSISTANNIFCSGQTVIFDANPGTSLTNSSYVWTINGVVQGTNASQLSVNNLTNNSVIQATVTSTDLCLNNSTAQSNQIEMTLGDINVSANLVSNISGNICPGDEGNFNLNLSNTLSNVSYTWFVNGINQNNNNTSLSNVFSNTGTFEVYATIATTDACVVPSEFSSNIITVNVTTQNIAATISVSPTVTPCIGTPVTFTSEISPASNYSFQWLINGIPVAGETSQSFITSNYTSGDEVTLLITTNDNCISGSPFITNAITLNPILANSATVEILPSSSVICTGETVTFNTNTQNAGTNPIFTWFVNGIEVQTGNSSSFVTNSLPLGATVSVVMQSSEPCITVPATNTASITINQGFNVTTTQVAPKCHNSTDGSITALPAGGIPPFSYSWNGIPGSETLNGVNQGSFFLVVTDATGCSNSQEITLAGPLPISLSSQVTVDQTNTNLPDGSISVTIAGGTAPYTFVWNTTPPQFTNSATGLSAGDYTVTVTDINGCTASYTFTVKNVTSIAEEQMNEISIYPNPNSGVINVSSNGKNLNFELFDITGKQVFATTIVTDIQQIDISELEEGLYFAKFSGNGNIKVIRCIKK